MKTKNMKRLAVLLVTTIFFASCKQDVITLQQPKSPPTTTPSSGSADFTMYVAIGNSLTAGFQAGALFNEGQSNSFPKILSTKFSLAKDPTGVTQLAFNQPDINSVNGYNSSYSNPGAGVIRGRLVLFAADGVIEHAVPTPAGATGVPAPYNTADLPTAYAGDTTKLNNFGVPGIVLAQCLIKGTGTPGDPYENKLYTRFASMPGTSTIIGDAIRKQPTFFTFDLGNNDVLGYATTGGNQSIKMTSQASFQTYYATAIGALMAKTSAKGVVTTIPDVTSIPFFTTITWDYIGLDQPHVDALMAANAFGGYNTVLNALIANAAAFGISPSLAAEIGTRKVNYTVSAHNQILILDETLTDLGPYFDALKGAGQISQAQRDGLVPYQKVRQTTSNDLIPLTAGAVLGKPGTFGILGVSEPLGDKYVLIKQEKDSVLTATAGFNTIIKAVAAANNSSSTRIAVADVNLAFTTLVNYKAIVEDGVTITPDFTPPTGAFSEDGVHPNSRGYAYMANIIIDAINSTFGANVPKVSIAAYKNVGLPLVP